MKRQSRQLTFQIYSDRNLQNVEQVKIMCALSIKYQNEHSDSKPNKPKS